MKRVCVIGAGPSGITAIKNLLDEGIDVVGYDRNKEVGGNWIYNEEESHSSVFETTHIISSKTLSQYEDFTFDDFDPTVADYPSHDELRRYFQAYARKFNVYSYIEFETMVLRCDRINDQQWNITIAQNGQERTERFTDLIVCNGHHWQPRYPEYPGEFTGVFMHSHQYKKAEPFRDKRVLVIGGGNSACDVAVETSRVSAFTGISMRRGYRIIPKFVFGIPTDVFSSKALFVPRRLRMKISDFLIRILIGSNKEYGLQEPTQSISATHPTINSELLYKLRHGKVKPYGDIERFEGKKVFFKDGRSVEVDVIVACTGYVIVHPFFDTSFIDYSSGPVPLYLKMLHESYKNLYFVGLFQPLGCIWPGAELQSKIVARELAGKWKRPRNMKARCKREVNNPHFKQIDSPRHTITVDYHDFVKELKKHLPKNYVSKEPVPVKQVS